MSGVILTGDAYKQGFLHGRACADAVVRNIEVMKTGRDKMASRGRDYDYEGIVDNAVRFASSFRPTFEDELRGIADGSGANYRDVLHHNLPVYLLATLLPWECSQVLVGRARTGDGQIRLAKTRDTRGDSMTNVLLHRTMPDGMELVEVTHAGSITITGSGMNSAGLMFSTSGIWSKRTVLPFEDASNRWLVADVGGLLRTCTTIDEFHTGLEQHGRAANLNLACADATGAMAALEVSQDRVVRVDAQDGFLVRTNHFHAPELVQHNPTPEEYESTYQRYETATAFVEKEPVSQDRMWAIVGSHEHSPTGCICRHREQVQDGSVTTYAAVSSWPEGRMEAWVGYPCQRRA
jgi:isopenicillin-N N-acyltransferase-like protein